MFAPFESELEWRVACWAIQDGIGHKSFDRLMAIPGVSERLGLSYHNIRGLHKIVDSVPPRACWKTRELWFKNDPEHKHTIYHRNPIDAVKTLLGNPAHANDIVYRPRRVFTNASRDSRIYNEMWTGDWWNTVQDRLPAGSCVAPVIIATDKTQLTQFAGDKSAYPVYLTLGNLPRAIRWKPSQHACILVAYLSVSKMVGVELSKKQKSTCIQQLFHDSMRIVLEPLIEAGKSGVEVTGGDGKVRMVHLILACYVADYPEQCLVTCAEYGTCPKCEVDNSQMGNEDPGPWRTQHKTSKIIEAARANSTSISNFQERCKQDNISGGVRCPFWEGFPHCDIHMSITPDNGWSHLAQISGKERKDMGRILLGCIIGKAPSQMVACYRALLDFIYISQYPSHNKDSLGYLQVALEQYHANKCILIDLGIRDHLNIPKLHSMQHYAECIRNFGTTDNYNTEMFEHFHIDYAKEGWRATNFRDELPQMTQWLSRQEKVAMFETYLKDYQPTEVEREQEEQDALESEKRPGVGLAISKKPASPSQLLTSIISKH
ncbi:uncharacterized protein EDB91DRAFT_1235852 [Suillus paluster]|uniref:uncharacterized protein n=1 Tax=Suillus paluster TaxID=48578 RepID=UPI001B864F40|nr:uncharacterized protein EDB91DRAFT_1238172 [Suillus paluster]XP_041180557.1 uncharacterized protein EDB91DRAFT_1235852 [Suillus paluster]KAG1735953.1 hypothetical protein EDB91DRAFT_1238172 [Suillus paluster]KAG1748010.1 hypothetical protein EDB91DRAFT_1235852 [Suillus paluster]